MIKGTPELIADRRETIINACEQLYATMPFREITLKEIGALVPFSRPTIYNYFQTKEEIFLALFTREYDRWNADLDALLQSESALSKPQLAGKIAETLTKRPQLLRLLAMNNFDMEANSRPELLAAFKTSYGRSLSLVKGLLHRFCPALSDAEVQNVLYVFFPFMFGIYPYTAVTDKQKEAMKQAGVDFAYRSVYELVYNCLIRLLGESD